MCDIEDTYQPITYSKDEILSAPPYLDPRVSEIIEHIKLNPCFIEKYIGTESKHYNRSDKPQARGNVTFKRSQRKIGYTNSHDSKNGNCISAPKIIKGNELISRDIRSINDGINKVTTSNYNIISKRLKLVLDDGNIVYGIDEILDKAYEQSNRCSIYVDLVFDIIESLPTSQKQRIHELLNERLSGSLQDTCKFPRSDPVQDYDGFCKIVKSKVRTVGRCNTFSRMMGKVKTLLGYTPLEYYDHHEQLIFKYNDEENIHGDVDIDITASIETILDCLQVIIQNHNSLKKRFERSFSNISYSKFPSNNCRFKILDILGK
jgi:hypothetical protein